MTTTNPDGGLPATVYGTLPQQAGSYYDGDNPKLFFSDVISAFYRRWKLALGSALVAGTAVLAITMSLTPMYTSNSTLVIEPRVQQTVIMDEAMGGLPAESYVVDTEVEVLRSPTLAQKVVENLKLESDPEFNLALRNRGMLREAIDSMMNFARGWLDRPQYAAVQDAAVFGTDAQPWFAPASEGALGDGQIAANRQQQTTLNNFRKGLSVERVGLTYAIRVSFTSEDPQKAQAIAANVAEEYLRQQIEMKSDAMRQANEMIASRVESLRNEVAVAEQRVADYTSENSLLNASGSSLTEQGISALMSELASARAEQAEHEARLSAALDQAAAGGSGAVAEAVASDTVRILRQQHAEVLREKADLETRYGDLHPGVINIRRQAADLQLAIDAEINRVIGSLRANVIAARQRTASLQGSIDGERDNLARNNSATVGLAELERNATAVRTVYETFLSRLEQTTEQQGMELTDARVVAQATLPLASSYPPWSLAGAAAIGLALLAAMASVVTAEMRDDRFKSPAEAEDALGLPVFAAIPAIRHRRPSEYVVEKPLSQFTEAFRNLEAALFLSHPNARPKTITLISALPGEGKTTSVLALARLCSLSGARVAIVDADLRHRALSRQMDFSASPGLLEVIAGEAQLKDCLRPDGLSTVMILPAGDGALSRSNLLLTREAKSVFDELRAKFDIVLIDTAPILPVAESRLVARHADAAVVLTRWYHTSSAATAEAIKAARSANVPVMGIVMTRVDTRRQSSFAYSPHGRNYQRSYASYYIE